MRKVQQQSIRQKDLYEELDIKCLRVDNIGFLKYRALVCEQNSIYKNWMNLVASVEHVFDQ